MLTALINYAIGQDYCDPTQRPPSTVEGGFTISAKRVCVGNSITVTNTKTAATSVKYIYGYTKDSSLALAGTAKTTYTFPRPGRYKILQAGSLQATAMIHCEEIEVLPLDVISIVVKSCSGRKVTVVPDVSTLGQYDKYIISWGDGNIDELSRTAMEANPEHTYLDNSSDTRTVTVEGAYGITAPFICKSPAPPQTIKLLPTVIQPAITALKTVSDNSISITYQAGTGAVVQLLRKINGVYTDTGLKESAPGTFSVQTDARQVQCFQVVAQDVCSSSGLRSDEVCSLVLDVKAGNKKNTLNWQPYAGTAASGRFQSYRIARNGSPLGGTIASQNTTTYSDENAIVCGTQYCYSLAATIAGSVAQTEITSASICVTGVNGDVPDNLNDVVVTVENNRPKLTVSLPASTSGTLSSYTLAIGRSDAFSGAFTPIGNVLNDNTFIDNSANASAGSYCYQVTYQGVCGLTLPPSKPACTVFLSAKAKTELGWTINWTSESPFTLEPVTNYTIEVIDSLSGTTQQAQLGNNTQFDVNQNDPHTQTLTYRIMAKSGGKISYSNVVTLYKDTRIWTPDAFTPNGDRLNDEFLPRGISGDHFLMNIYSRWGDVVYSTTDKTKGWNGLINGKPASIGQYMYRIEVEDVGGQKTVRTGAVLLLR